MHRQSEREKSAVRMRVRARETETGSLHTDSIHTYTYKKNMSNIYIYISSYFSVRGRIARNRSGGSLPRNGSGKVLRNAIKS